ncbi:MAG: hypothetical protein IKC87_05385 [Clostridia bacterium]|nr:hypothetical protein [Clostridia bacterium]
MSRYECFACAKRDMSPRGDAIFRLWRSDMLSEGKRDMFSRCENVRETRRIGCISRVDTAENGLSA